MSKKKKRNKHTHTTINSINMEWTEKEIELLKDVYPVGGISSITDYINRPKKDILSKVSELGIIYNEDGRKALNIINLPETSELLKAAYPTYGYGMSHNRKSLLFENMDIKFSTITTIFDTESYFRKAVDKYVEAIFRNGFDFVADNTKAAEYIKMRFTQMENFFYPRQTTRSLLEEIATDLVMYYNVFIVRIRKNNVIKNARGFKIGGIVVAPTVGLKVQNIEMVKMRQLDTGEVLEYRIQRFGMKTKDIDSRDMIHMHLKRKPGTKSGTPMIVPVIDDIRALRSLEETVAILAFQNAVPLLHMRIGQDGVPVSPTLVNSARYKFINMKSYGLWVTDWQYKIESIGSAGKALDLSNYLEYFTQRVLAGFGMSTLDAGHGDSSNRNTATALTKSFIEMARWFQDELEDQVQSTIIYEMLIEGGFDITDPANLVELYMPDIDIDTQIKKESHLINLFTSNGITHDELRQGMRRDPLLPEQEKRLSFNMIQMPQLEAKNAISAKNISNPTNQYGTKLARTPTKDNIYVCAKILEIGMIQTDAEKIKEAYNFLFCDDSFKDEFYDRLSELFKEETTTEVVLSMCINFLYRFLSELDLIILVDTK